MDAPTAATPASSRPDAAPAPGPGWLALRDCALGGGGPRVGLALLHPGFGVALVASGTREADAADRLRRALDARRFAAIFGGYPPIVRAVEASGDAQDLGRALAAAFAAQPPLALAGGDAWVGAVRAALEAESPVAAPVKRHPPPRRPVFPWRAAAAIAAIGGGSAALALALAPPGQGSAARRPAALASAAAPLASAPGPTTVDWPAEGGLTALDVAAALVSAQAAAAAAAAKKGAADGRRPEPTTAPAPALQARPTPPPAGPPAAAVERAPGAAPPPRATNTGGVAVASGGPGEAGRARPPAPTRTAAAGAGAGWRCREVVVRASAGEALSEGDREFLRRGCQPKG